MVMAALWVLVFMLMKSCTGSDYRCTSQSGHCQEDSLTCTGGYESGLCDGHASRRCCMPSSGSTSCSLLGGHCQGDNYGCSGSYVSGLCPGPATTRCCTSSSHMIFNDTGDCDNVRIITRDSWGARRPDSIVLLHNQPVPYFFIHHTESPPCSDEHTCARKMKSFQDYHMNTHGWSDIGYSFLVGEDGNVYEGRGWNRQGAHTVCHNTDALAASMIGDFSTHLPNMAAQNAVKALVECGVKRGYISNTYGLFGHRDANPTSCPGDALYYHLPSMWPSHYHIHKQSLKICK